MITELLYALAFVIGLVGLILIYYTLRTSYQYLQLKDLPGPPRSNLILGHFDLDLMQHEAQRVLNEYGTTYSPVFRVRFGPFGYYVICSHPDSIKAVMSRNDPKTPDVYDILEPWLGGSILLTNGKTWQRSRKILTPAFHLDILKDYVVVNNDCAEVMMSKWSSLAEASPRHAASVEIYEDIKQLTLDILMRCIFSQQTDCQTSSLKHPYLEAVNRLTSIVGHRAFDVLTFHPIAFNLFYGSEFRKNCKEVHEYSLSVIRTRKAQLLQSQSESQQQQEAPKKRKRIDFIDILLTCLHEDGSPVTDVEIQPEVDMFMFAGHDTTSSGLSWALYHLAAHPEAQRRCREEALRVLDGRTAVQHSDLNELSYITCCIKESLRLFPPVPFIGRRLEEPLTLPSGQVLPKGVTVILGINMLHHNANVWEEPYIYDPSRFDQENSVNRAPHAFIPFSAGSRNCIGQFFALNILKTVVALLLTRFVFEVDVSNEHRFLHDIITRPRNGLHLIVKPFVDHST